MKIRGGEAVVKSLVENAVKTVYGLPGFDVLSIYDSLRDESRINHITVMHEINAAFMADAHGRLTGDPGVCLVTAGPGATNAITGIAQAYTEASPVVQITGHPSTKKKTQPNHCVDDWEFLLKIHTPLTKWSARIEKVEDIPPTLNKAFSVAKSGRPGPVHLEVPRDILEGSGRVGEFRASPNADSPDSTSSVDRVAELLRSASRPLIVVGRGVLREFCSDGVVKLARSLGAVILTLQSSMSALPYTCPLYVGYDLGMHTSINSVIEESDVILTLGFDIGERLTCFTEENCALIHVHHDASTRPPDEMTTQRLHPAVDVKASLKDFVSSLEGKIRRKHASAGSIEEEVSDIKKKIRDDIAKSIAWGKSPLHPGEISTELRRALDDDAIVTIDVGSSAEWMTLCYRANTSNTILKSGRYGSMGFALPAAIAAKINFPERQVVAVIGDGGFLMSYMDLSTIVKYNLEIVIVVESNQHYGLIWQLQRSRYRGRTFATELATPKLAELARAFGIAGWKVETPQGLRSALEEAVNLKGPVLLDVDTEYKFPPYLQTRTRRYVWRLKRIRDGVRTRATSRRKGT
jgi:acetolactate synthase-1/2/3 large subunit